MIDPLSAIGAASGSSVAGLSAASSSAAAPPAAAPDVGPSFSETLGQVAGQAMDTLKTGEATAIQGINGTAPPLKVVDAMMDAQRTLQAALAIRDKAVGAYQEVSRMAI
jgi:flagellar hook-basal body complex protein FliE